MFPKKFTVSKQTARLKLRSEGLHFILIGWKKIKISANIIFTLEFSFFTAAALLTTFLQVCFPGLKPCKRWDENCWGKKSFETLSFLSFKRANPHFTDVHLHSYCRMFFHSRVYNTYSSQICPHSCQPASHMISGSFLISQLWSETLKLWKQTVWKLLEAEALSCNPLK